MRAEAASCHSPARTPSGKSWPPWKTREEGELVSALAPSDLSLHPLSSHSHGHCCHSIRDRPTGPHSTTTHPLCSSVSTASELTGPLCFYRDIHGRFPIDGSVFCTLYNDHTLARSSEMVTLRPILTTQAWLSRYSMVNTSFKLFEDPSVSCRSVILRDVGDILLITC